MDKDLIIELFRQLTAEDKRIVIDLMKISLTMSTVDLYKIIEEFEANT